MNWIAILLASGVLAALVSGFVTFLASERRLASENVIQARKDWREHVRDVAEQIYQTIVSGSADADKLRQLRAKLALRLNPHDPADQQILSLIGQANTTHAADHADEINERIALLLKHDWERARREADLWLWLFTMRPERMSFDDYRRGEPPHYRRWRPWIVAAQRLVSFVRGADNHQASGPGPVRD